RDYAYDRTRYGLGGTLDYRFDGGTTLFVRGLWSELNNFGTRYRFDVASDHDSSAVATANGGVGSGAPFLREVQGRRPNGEMDGVSAGGKSLMGTLGLDYGVNVGGTRQSVVNYRTTSFGFDGPGGDGVSLAYNTTDRSQPMFHFTSGSDSTAAMNAGNYNLT